MSYADSRRQWQQARDDAEAAWWATIEPRLRAGSVPTHVLADACRVKSGREYSRFTHFLLKRLRIVGKTMGPSNHESRIWALKEAA